MITDADIQKTRELLEKNRLDLESNKAQREETSKFIRDMSNVVLGPDGWPLTDKAKELAAANRRIGALECTIKLVKMDLKKLIKLMDEDELYKEHLIIKGYIESVLIQIEKTKI